MMQTNIMISGTGGQGILAAADFLSESLFRNGFHVVGTRSYGAEARGGSAQSVVIASDKEIYDIQFEVSDAMHPVFIFPTLSQDLDLLPEGARAAAVSTAPPR